MESIVAEHITGTGMTLALSTGNPRDVIRRLPSQNNVRGLYFLDVDLQHKIDGITLGRKIRAIDPLAKIVFITTHGEAAVLTFKHKIAAMDFIVKDLHPESFDTDVVECIKTAYKNYQAERDDDRKYFQVNMGSEAANIPLDDILFFETHPLVRKRIILHTENSKVNFRGIISDVEKLVPEFYRCYQSNLINLDKVVRVDKMSREVVFTNGQRALVAEKNVATLARLICSEGCHVAT